MIAVIVEESVLNVEFASTLQRLDLDTLKRSNGALSAYETDALRQLHRAFVAELHDLKTRLRRKS